MLNILLRIIEHNNRLSNHPFFCRLWPKNSEKAKLCYMDADSFSSYMKTDDIYKDIEEDIETRSDTSNYELDTPLPKEKMKK